MHDEFAGSITADVTDTREDGRRLLIIDDEPAIARFIAHALEEGGYRPTISLSADRFRAEYQAAEPEAVVIDLAMPGGDGIELLRFLAEQGSPARVLIVSGFDERVLESALRLGRALGLDMAPPLTKPVRVQELIDALKAPAGAAR